MSRVLYDEEPVHSGKQVGRQGWLLLFCHDFGTFMTEIL